MNREFLFDAPNARAEYLARAGRVFARSDWTALGYALMSSHVHWLARAGHDSSDLLIRSLHVGFAGWLNRSTSRLGPVFADRHRNVECASETALAMLAYIHNNPVRAGVVSDPRETRWTSHRAYLGLEQAPPWLDIESGLHLCGYESTTAGRAAFHAFVAARASDPQRPDLTAANLHRELRAARHRTALPIDVSSPRLTRSASGVEQQVPWVVPATSPLRPSWHDAPLVVLRVIAQASGVSVSEMRGRSRERRVCAARRQTLLVWVRGLSRPAIEMAHVLGLSSTATSYHLRASTPEEQAAAYRCTQLLLQCADEVKRAG